MIGPGCKKDKLNHSNCGDLDQRRIGAKVKVEERESICANDWEWTRGPDEAARPAEWDGGAREGWGRSLPPFPSLWEGWGASRVGTSTSPPPWVARKVNTLYLGLWATRPPSTAMAMIATIVLITTKMTNAMIAWNIWWIKYIFRFKLDLWIIKPNLGNAMYFGN